MQYNLKRAFIHYKRNDEDKWPEPPHLAFANLDLGGYRASPKGPEVVLTKNSKALLMFEKLYGPISRSGPRWQPRSFSTKFNESSFRLRKQELRERYLLTLHRQPTLDEIARFKKMLTHVKADGIVGDGDWVEVKKRQHVLRKAWKGDGVQLKRFWAGFPNVESDEDTHGLVRVTVAFGDDGAVHLFIESMWDFIRLAFQQDYLEGKIHVCANPECSAPYFISAKKPRGQPRKYCGRGCGGLINVRKYRERKRGEKIAAA